MTEPLSVDADHTEAEKSTDVWPRALYMLLFLIILGVVKGITFGVSVVQFILFAINKTPNQQLTKFDQGLGTYLYDITQYLVFSSDEKPFPFADWRTMSPSNKERVINLGSDDS